MTNRHRRRLCTSRTKSVISTSTCRTIMSIMRTLPESRHRRIRQRLQADVQFTASMRVCPARENVDGFIHSATDHGQRPSKENTRPSHCETVQSVSQPHATAVSHIPKRALRTRYVYISVYILHEVYLVESCVSAGPCELAGWQTHRRRDKGATTRGHQLLITIKRAGHVWVPRKQHSHIWGMIDSWHRTS